TASFTVVDQEQIESQTDGHKIVTTQKHVRTVPLPLDASRVGTGLHLEYRQKGLLWYSTYVVEFDGTFTFRNPSSSPQQVTFRLPFPAERAIYDNLKMELNGHAQPFYADKQGASVASQVGAGETAVLRAGYNSRGLGSWRYKLGDDISQVRDFVLTVNTDF